MIGDRRQRVNRLCGGTAPIRDDSFTTHARKSWTVPHSARYALAVLYLWKDSMFL